MLNDMGGRVVQQSDEARQHAALDDLLERWHRWCQAQRVTSGLPSRSASCWDYSPGRSYDDDNGANDARIEAQIMRGVDEQVWRLHDPHRTAILVHARNLHSGVSVWASARLPAHAATRERILVEARADLIRRLMRADLL